MMDDSIHFYIVDWVVLVVYFACTMGIGAYFYRKTRSTEGFTAANRSLPGWLCGLSIFATFLSSISYLALPGKSFADNWNPFVFSLAIPLVTWIAVRYFLPYYRARGEVSAYAALEHRFGLWARLYGSIFYLLTQMARVGVVLYLMALPMQVIFGWNIYTILIATGICVTVYSFIGGIMAVIWNDAIQALVLMGGALICLTVMLLNLPGGAGQVFEVAKAHDKFSLGSFGPSLAESTFWVVLIYGIAINLQNFGIDQSYIQRYIASSTDREARRSLWLAGLLYVPVSAVFFFIGTTLFAYYGAASTQPIDGKSGANQVTATADLEEVRTIVARQRLRQQGIDPSAPDYEARQAEITASLELSEVGDRAFPHFIAKHLPPGVTGLLVAAVFAAAMSTVSTSLNSSATLVMSDYYRRLIKPDANEHSSMIVLYVSTILFGAIGTGLALGLVSLTDSALDIWWTLAGIFGGGITGLFLLGLISRTAGNPAAVTGVITGIVVILWMSIPKFISYLAQMPKGSGAQQFAAKLESSTHGWTSPLHAYMVPVVGTLVILLVGLAVSTVWPRSETSSVDT